MNHELDINSELDINTSFNDKVTEDETVEIRARTIKFEGFPLSPRALELLSMAPMNLILKD